MLNTSFNAFWEGDMFLDTLMDFDIAACREPTSRGTFWLAITRCEDLQQPATATAVYEWIRRKILTVAAEPQSGAEWHPVWDHYNRLWVAALHKSTQGLMTAGQVQSHSQLSSDDSTGSKDVVNELNGGAGRQAG